MLTCLLSESAAGYSKDVMYTIRATICWHMAPCLKMKFTHKIHKSLVTSTSVATSRIIIIAYINYGWVINVLHEPQVTILQSLHGLSTMIIYGMTVMIFRWMEVYPKWTVHRIIRVSDDVVYFPFPRYSSTQKHYDSYFLSFNGLKCIKYSLKLMLLAVWRC